MLKKKILSLFLVILLFSSYFTLNVGAAVRFRDLNKAHWAYNSVSKMVEEGVLEGFEDGTFRPNSVITREQFAKMLVLALNLPLQNPKKPTFEDVPRNHWAYQYIETAKQYITGYTDNDKLYFRGDEEAVREDMATAIVLVKGLDGQIPDLNCLDKYADENQISPWIMGYIAIAVKNNIMEGDGNYFYPNNTLTRSQACELIYKSSLENSSTQQAVNASQLDNTVLSADYQTYNDGNITFQYPYGLQFRTEQHNTPIFPNVKKVPTSIADIDGIEIEVNYTNQGYDRSIDSTGGTTLDDTYRLTKALNDEISKSTKTTFKIQKYDNCVENCSYTNPSNPKHCMSDIYARGIGEAIPKISVDNYNANYMGDTENSYNKLEVIKNQILKSLKVINAIPPKEKDSKEAPAQSGITIINTAPSKNETNVDVDTKITINCSSNIKYIFASAISMKDNKGNEVQIKLKYSTDNFTIQSLEKLQPNTTYMIFLRESAVCGENGGTNDEYVLNFSTGSDLDLSKYITYNDNIVTFKYPNNINFKPQTDSFYTIDDNFVGQEGRSLNHIATAYSVKYIDALDGPGKWGDKVEDTSLEGIYAAAVNKYGAKNVEKDENLIVVYQAESVSFYGAGIGEIIPSLTINVPIMTYDPIKVSNLHDLLKEFTEQAKNSFKVIYETH